MPAIKRSWRGQRHLLAMLRKRSAWKFSSYERCRRVEYRLSEKSAAGPARDDAGLTMSPGPSCISYLMGCSVRVRFSSNSGFILFRFLARPRRQKTWRLERAGGSSSPVSNVALSSRSQAQIREVQPPIPTLADRGRDQTLRLSYGRRMGFRLRQKPLMRYSAMVA